MVFFTRVIVVSFFLLISQLSRSQNDCVDGIVVCGNTGFEGLTAIGVGIQEVSSNNTCSSEENNSIWLKLPIMTSGTLAFTLTPESDDINEDFDFFIFGPTTSCNNLGMAIRCSTTNPSMAGQFDNLTGMNSVETDTTEGPGELGNSFVQEINVTAGDIYYMVIDRPIGESNFSINWNGTASFETQPQIVSQPQNLQKCTPLGEQALFNLNANYNAIVGGQGNVLLSYHTNSNDAITGANPILAPAFFPNTSNPQTIFVRLTNPVSGCFSMADFQLAVTFGPTVAVDTYTICDDAFDGNGTNGQSLINLNTVTQTILAGQDMTGVTVSYFNTLIGAQQNLLPTLPNQFYNTIPNLHNVFVRITNTTGCVQTKEIHLRVLPQPAIISTTLTQCDIGLLPDGLTLFDLNEAIPMLTSGNANLSVSFFENGNLTPLGLQYANLSNPQQLTAIITNNSTGCKSTSTVSLIVNVTPPPIVTIAPQCDILGIENGKATFDLTSVTMPLSPTQVISYYQNPNEALLGINQIANTTNYINTIPYNDLIYVRIEDSGACLSISNLQLVVNKLPQATLEETGSYVCIDNPDYFIKLNAAILEGSPSDYTYNWFHDGIAMGQNGYTVQVNGGGIYTVDITKIGCSITRTIIVQESANPNIGSIVVNDLATAFNTVTVNVQSQSLGDYIFALDSATGPFQESNVFYDVAPGIHELYIKDLLACGIFGPVQVNVLGLPKYFTPNGDGFNDTWNITGVDVQHYSKTIIFIFDRYGKLLKQISPLGKGWDGLYNDQLLPAADYWYNIQLEDGRNIKNHFTLKR